MNQGRVSSIRRIFTSSFFYIAGCLILALFLFGNVRAFYQDYKIRQEIKQMEAEIGSLSKRKIESLEILEYVMSPNFVEAKARTELNLKRPGERVIVVPPSPSETKTGADELSDTSSGQMPNNPLRWWYYFTHKPQANGTQDTTS